jgi:hypothetical protein
MRRNPDYRKSLSLPALRSALCLILLSLPVGGGCGNDSGTMRGDPTEPDDVVLDDDAKADGPAAGTFQPAFARFVAAWQAKDTATLDRFIHPTHGFFVVLNPGAMVVAANYAKIEEASGYFPESPLVAIDLVCNLKRGKLPEFSCDDEEWDKTGCFWSTATGRILAVAENLQEENAEDDYDPAVVEKAKALDAVTTRAVYSTDSNIGFYFGKVRGHWTLTAVDIVTQCEA